MASFVKNGNSWRAYVKKNGVRRTAQFPTKSAAKEWAIKTEALLADSTIAGVKKIPVRDLLDRYMSEVTPKKRGAKWETIRLLALCKMPIADVLLTNLKDTDIIRWRDERLKTVSAGTVLREWTVLSSVFSMALKEWKLIKKHPMEDVRRPKEPPPRERRISEDEIERLKFVVDFEEATAKTRSQRMCACFLFAIETAMRAGEILSLSWSDVDLNKRVAHLSMTKNGTARDVPLSSRAVQLIKYMPRDADTIFDLTSSTLDALFRKYRDKAGIVGLHFHDTRHEAITRLAKKLDVLDLARMVGHKKLNQLMTYYNATAEELVDKLD